MPRRGLAVDEALDGPGGFFERDTSGLRRIRADVRKILRGHADAPERGRTTPATKGSLVNRLTLLTLLALLGGIAPARAADLEILSPRGEVWVRPGELVEVTVAGTPGQAVTLGSATLPEVAPGVFRATLPLGEPVNVSQGAASLPLGPIRLLTGALPAVEVTQDAAVYRTGPDEAFDRYDPLPKGYRSLVSGRQNDWVRLEPAGGWVALSQARLLEPGEAISRPVLSGIRISETADGGATVRVKLTDPAPWQVVEELEARRLVLRLPATREAMGEIMYAETPRRIPAVRLDPSDTGTTVVFALGDRPLWGYRAEWKAPELVLTLAPQPRLPRLHSDQRPLEGLTVAVDPGHGGDDPGAVGRDGLVEKDLNLQTSLALRDALQAAGARVVLTRDTDRSVAAPGAPADEELGARVKAALAGGAQILLSVHHNARPTVAEGRVSHGTHIYYYRPHSRVLAQALAEPIARSIGEPDHAALWRSFYVIRQAAMPASLLEYQFLSNPEWEARMARPDYARKAADGTVEGLIRALRSQISNDKG